MRAAPNHSSQPQTRFDIQDLSRQRRLGDPREMPLLSVAAAKLTQISQVAYF
jgi:hypothetical protein